MPIIPPPLSGARRGDAFAEGVGETGGCETGLLVMAQEGLWRGGGRGRLEAKRDIRCLQVYTILYDYHSILH